MRVFRNIVRGFSLVHHPHSKEGVVFKKKNALSTFPLIWQRMGGLPSSGSHYENPDEANLVFNLRRN